MRQKPQIKFEKLGVETKQRDRSRNPSIKILSRTNAPIKMSEQKYKRYLESKPPIRENNFTVQEFSHLLYRKIDKSRIDSIDN